MKKGSKHICVAVLAAFLFLPYFSFAGGNYDFSNPTKLIGLNAKNAISSQVGLTVNIQPALFWSSMGTSVEYTLNRNMGIGVNFVTKFGSIEGNKNNSKIRPEDYQEPGFMAELYFRYYPKIKGTRLRAPFGPYVQFSLGYNQIVYFDGNTRPLTLHNRWKKLDADDPNKEVLIDRPKPIIGGIGGGYQVMLIPRFITGNIMIGIQTNIDATNNLFLSVYLMPSLGITF